MAKTYDVIYMDACVIFDCLTKLPKYYPHVEPILRDAKADKLTIVASTICFSEVFMIRDDPDGAEKIEAFFNQEFVAVYDVDDLIARKAGEIRSKAKLETADALHLATAIAKGAQVFLTRDGDGERAKKANKETILELRQDLSQLIEIMTPAEYFTMISSASKQMEITPDEPEEESHEEE